MEPDTYKVTITLGSRTKELMGGYHTMHNIDWNEKIREMLDDQYEADQERNYDHAQDNRI